MIKMIDKLKERFDRYDINSLLMCVILIAINICFLIHLKDCIFIGSIIPLIIIIIIKIKGDNNKENPIDDVDQFYVVIHKQFKNYRSNCYFLAAFFHLIMNYCLHCYGYERVLYNTSYPKEIGIFILIYIEFIFFGLSALVSDLLINPRSPYDFRSEVIFYSRDKYLIRIWNFLCYRKEVWNSFNGKRSNFKIWRENSKIIVADKIGNLKKELQSLDDDFLKKIYYYHLYPYDFGGNSEARTDDLFEKIPKFVGFLLPIVLGYLFNDFKNFKDILLIIQLSAFVWLIWLGLDYFWKSITRQNLLNQLKVILPLLINEELENRKNEELEIRKKEELENLKTKRKYKRPHRYK